MSDTRAPSLNSAADELIQALEATGPLLGLRHGLLAHLATFAHVAEGHGAAKSEAAQLLGVWMAFDKLVDAVHSRRADQ